jgi:hypothetical protein
VRPRYRGGKRVEVGVEHRRSEEMLLAAVGALCVAPLGKVISTELKSSASAIHSSPGRR